MAKRKGRPQGLVLRNLGAPASPKAQQQEAAGSEPTASPSGEQGGPTSSDLLAATGPSAKKRKKKRRQSDATASDNGDAAAASACACDGEEAADALDVASVKGLEDGARAVSGASQPPTGEAEGNGAAEPQAAEPLGPPPWESDAAARSPAAALSWLLWPMSTAQFLREYWEKKPLHLTRGKADYYSGLFSKAELDKHLASGTEFPYGKRISLARFDPKTEQKVGVNRGSDGALATAHEVGEAWEEGASIQVMHPQQFQRPVWALLASLEGSFGALCGANAYLTPAGWQGLAPHFDDVEVFMLQLEGSKHWKLHRPPAGEEHPLPRDYSRDFRPSELGELVLDCTLQQGDLLYLPRGIVHSGRVEPETGFSHHLTVSTYQRTAWCDMLEKVLSKAVERAAEVDAEFRTGLPLGFLGCMGSWQDGASGTGEVASGRATFKRRFRTLLTRLQEYIDLDEVCDELGVDFMAQRLPPPKHEGRQEAPSSSTTTRDVVAEAARLPVEAGTRLRFKDASSMRFILNADPETSEPTVMLFHSLTNSRENHMCRAVDPEEEVGCLRYDASTFLPALRALASAGQQFVRCGNLPMESESDKVALCENLHEAGLVEIMASVPTAGSGGS